MNRIVLTHCAVLCLALVVTSQRQCYSGVGDGYSKTSCYSNVIYCTKVTVAGVITRACDNPGNNLCNNQGPACTNQGSVVGDICCCNSDNCNSAPTTTKNFLLGSVTLAAGLMACYMH